MVLVGHSKSYLARALLVDHLCTHLDSEHALPLLAFPRTNTDTQSKRQTVRRIKLEKQRDKLLEAYYAGAVTLEMMKADQTRIESELKTLKRQIIASVQDHELVVKSLEVALAYASNLAAAYQSASPTVRRGMNRAMFERIYVNRDGVTGIELRKLFEALLHPDVVVASETHHHAIAKVIEVAEPTDCLDKLFSELVDSMRIKRFNPRAKNKQTTGTVNVGGLREAHLVGDIGLEPTTPAV